MTYLLTYPYIFFGPLSLIYMPHSSKMIWIMVVWGLVPTDGVSSWAIPSDETQKHRFIQHCGLRSDNAGLALHTKEQVECIARHASTSDSYRIRHRASTRSSISFSTHLRIPDAYEICDCVSPPDCRSASIDVSERCGCNNAETLGDYYCYTKGVCQNASYDPQSSWYYLSTTWRLCDLEYSPDDLDFSDQWYVRSHNVIAAWKDGYRGGQSTVVIVDDGIDYTHPDLAVDRTLSFGWSFDGQRVSTADVSSERNPDGRQPDHGTMCAGVNKAVCNNGIDLCGIAHDSTLIGVRLLREFSYSDDEDVDEGTSASPVGGSPLPMYEEGAHPSLLRPSTSALLDSDSAFVDPYFNASLYSTNRTSHNHSIPTFERTLTLIDSATIETLRELSTREATIISNSWGPRDGQGYIEGPGLRLWYASIDQAFRSIVPTGRNGKGMILVFAAGNGGPNDNVNDDGYASHDNTIAIAAIASNGRKTIYSEPGTCIDVVAYSSDYAQTFGTSHVISLSGSSVSGQSLFCCTSAAAAIASGIIALILDARPDLTIRDVRQILQRTAFRTDRNDPSWTLNAGGRWYSHWYGFEIGRASCRERV